MGLKLDPRGDRGEKGRNRIQRNWRAAVTVFEKRRNRRLKLKAIGTRGATENSGWIDLEYLMNDNLSFKKFDEHTQ